MNILSIEVELFTIRCSINQAVNTPNINCIVVITDAIHTAEKIPDFSCYSCQLYTIAILHKLKTFFQANPTNSIAFWDFQSNDKWLLYYAVNRETKIHTTWPLYPVEYHRNSARRMNTINILKYGRCTSKHLTTKVNTSWTLIMTKPQLPCYNLVKQLSHYLYFFSFSFLFSHLDLLHKEGVWESIT